MKENRQKLEGRSSPEQEDEMQALAELRCSAPPGFQRRVTAAISELGETTRAQDYRVWLPPVVRLAGALAAIFIVLISAVIYWQREPPLAGDNGHPIVVVFELNSPEAGKVDLVGDFTAWQPGQVDFDGPDENGNWRARMVLPEGRYEYLFLVDGKKWVTDVSAPAHRPDGFGNMNAIINL